MPFVPPQELSQTLFQPVVPSAKVGVVSGIGGFLLGGGIGILRSAHPGLVAVFTGTQFFVLGGSYFYSREVLLRAFFVDQSKRSALISSTAAGAFSGAAAGAFYGRVNSVTGAFVLGTLGHLGQRYVNAKTDQPRRYDSRSLFDRLAESRWIPFKSISNSDYESMLTEKLIKVEAEISMIDEKIAVLKSNQSESREAEGRAHKT